jgi:HK97 family phage portal protein
MSGFLVSLFERRFHISQEPPGWVEKMFGGQTSAGIAVDESSALQYVSVFACIRILAETLASLPLITYQRLANGGKARAVDFYLYPILHDMANPEMTAYAFRETLMGHAASWGNGYAQILFNRAGQVMEMWPLRPDRMSVKRVKGELQYIYRLAEADEQGKTERIFPAYQIFHLPGLGFDGVTGYSPIAMARQAIGLGLAAEEFGSRFFGNDARPGVVLEHPGQLSDPAYKNLKTSFEEEHGGVSKSHKPMILEEGMKLHEIGIPPEDAQFLETRKFQIQEIARLYRIPPHMLADMERSAYASIEQQSLEFVTQTIRPWLVRWEQCIFKSLLTASERKTYFAEHLLDGLLRGDTASRYAAYHIARQDGWMNADDIRALENMNPLPDGQGQIYLIPLNMVPADQVGAQPGGQSGQSRALLRASGAFRGLFQDAIGRVFRREKNDLVAASRKWAPGRDFDGFSAWLDEFYRDHAEFICRQLQPVAASFTELLFPGETRSAELARGYLDDYARRHVAISRQAVQEIIERARAEPLVDACGELETRFRGWIETGAGDIAAQESENLGQALQRGLSETT